MMRRIGSWLLLAGLLLLVACDGGEPEVAGAAAPVMERANPARTGVYPEPGLPRFEALKWQFKAEDWVFGAPAVSGDSVFAASYDGNLYALDRETGAEQWRFTTGDSVLAAPAVGQGLVTTGSMDGNIYALDAASGEERWRVEVGAGFTAAPAIVDGTVYYASENGLLLALDLATGD
jgi:outer membrane protein assembly factor BamB